MKPQFSMVSDSTDPLITGCTATWKLKSRTVEMHFDTGPKAFLMDNLIAVAYADGQIDGRAEVVRDVTNTLKSHSV